MPIHACSYYQYELFPGFMTFFYVMMYTLEVGLTCLRLYIFGSACSQFVGMLKRTRYYDGGLKALLTPWGCDKSPEVTQFNVIRLTLGTCILWMFSGLMFNNYINAIIAPGFGLINGATTSGKLYFGALWNYAPIPTCALHAARDAALTALTALTALAAAMHLPMLMRR